ncbi:MAG: glutamate--tRNA ligase [Candidatus Levybacteria bacterium RIFCSPLOWO2_01_FULL_39_10]|nr:MAG: glutamate--tRNA ligase [Candidatus Levybacteria bacterium RIFCSPLOWO2_01_FULL_39_10]
MENTQVRTRIAPSPTGYPHIGTIYQALFNFAFAKKNRGQFVLRIEDTDRARLVEDAEDAIFEALDWFGLSEDESPRYEGEYGPYRQSNRLEIYKKYVDELLEKGGCYYCFCTKERLDVLKSAQSASKQPLIYDRHCRNIALTDAKKRLDEPHVIRLKIPDTEKITVNDEIRGRIEFDPHLIEDAVLIKSDGYPTYHFAVVVDDYLMKITHVIRGEEWLSSLPKHEILYDYFGWDKPLFYHTPSLRNPDKSKLSKRQGHTSVSWYKDEGYLPEAILNFLALLGWSHPEEKEEFSLSEFIGLFDPKDLKPVGPIFDLTKLEWLNGVWIRKLPKEELLKRLERYCRDDESFSQVFDSRHINLLLGLAQSRMKKLSDFKILVNAPQKMREFSDEEKEKAKLLLSELSAIEHKDWREDIILNHLKNFKDKNEVSMKMVYFLITGREQGLPLIETMVKIEGREQILANIKSRTQ